MSPLPCVRTINAHATRRYNGRVVYPVLAQVAGGWFRITRARTRRGVLQVHVVATNRWESHPRAISLR